MIVVGITAFGVLMALLGYLLGHSGRPPSAVPPVLDLIDKHLLHAQDYVGTLSAEKADPRLNVLFTYLCETRRVLRGGE